MTQFTPELDCKHMCWYVAVSSKVNGALDGCVTCGIPAGVYDFMCIAPSRSGVIDWFVNEKAFVTSTSTI